MAAHDPPAFTDKYIYGVEYPQRQYYGGVRGAGLKHIQDYRAEQSVESHSFLPSNRYVTSLYSNRKLVFAQQ